jgi:hypothetical protein
MTDVEPLIVSELERMLPLPDGRSADWGEVLRRAGIPGGRRRWRPVVVAAVVVAALAAAAVAIADNSLFGFSNHGRPAPHNGLGTVKALHATSARPGSFVKLASRTGIAVYAAHRKQTNRLCVFWGGAGRNPSLGGGCVAPANFPSPSRPVYDVSSFYAPPPYFALHYLIGVAADGVRSVQVLAGPDCHPFVTVPVINNVYIDVLKPVDGVRNPATREDYIVARDAQGKVVWHKQLLQFPPHAAVPSCGLG